MRRAQAEQLGHEVVNPGPMGLVEALLDEVLVSRALLILFTDQAKAGLLHRIGTEVQRKEAIPLGMVHRTPSTGWFVEVSIRSES
ncbi:hypothetical protein D3C84_987920 [compost metagenome]